MFSAYVNFILFYSNLFSLYMEETPTRYYENFMIFVKTLWILYVLVYDNDCTLTKELFMRLLQITKRCIVTAFLCIFISNTLMPLCAAKVEGEVTSSALDANWPQGPGISSETAILIEANTGAILYEKNPHKQMYPASITKILTTLIATEESSLDENVTFTAETLATIPFDSSRIWVDSGEYLSMEDCLAAILIVSANDVAAGVAEHIGGTLEDFATLMNKRATELGCLNSHFVNSHGYHDPDHYTTAYDMSQIARAFFENDLLSNLSHQRYFKIAPSAGQPDEIWEFSKNQLFETRNYEYEYLVGSKTGYTDKAGQTLVSCAQKDGMKLICVVMNAESPNQYKDTVTLFDFGFSHFTTANIYENDKTYVATDSFYDVDVLDVLGNSTPLLQMDTDSIIILPKSASFSDTTSYITMSKEGSNAAATAVYQYGTHRVGEAQIYMSSKSTSIPGVSGALENVEQPDFLKDKPQTTVHVNIKKILFILVPSLIAAFFIYWAYGYITTQMYLKNPTLAKKGLKHYFWGIRNFFKNIIQSILSVGTYFKNIIRGIAIRTRHKKRNTSGSAYPIKKRKRYTSKKRRRSSRAYTTATQTRQVNFDLKSSKKRYTDSVDLKSKDIIFHDLKK